MIVLDINVHGAYKGFEQDGRLVRATCYLKKESQQSY